MCSPSLSTGSAHSSKLLWEWRTLLRDRYYSQNKSSLKKAVVRVAFLSQMKFMNTFNYFWQFVMILISGPTLRLDTPCSYPWWEMSCRYQNNFYLKPYSLIFYYLNNYNVYTRLQKRWHTTSVYNERWDSAKSYPNFPGRKRFIMRKDFPWIMREVNHWLCICANISHKGDGSCRSWIKLIRCQCFCNRVYVNSITSDLSLNP